MSTRNATLAGPDPRGVDRARGIGVVTGTAVGLGFEAALPADRFAALGPAAEPVPRRRVWTP